MSPPFKRRKRPAAAALIAAVIAGTLAVTETRARADRVTRLADAITEGSSEKERIAAAVNLGRIADPRALKPLLVALHDDSRVVRSVAATALGHLGYPAALPSLHQAAQDPDPSVRERARKAISRIEIKLGAKRRAARLLPRGPRRRASYQLSARERPRIPEPSPSLHIAVQSVADRSGRTSRAKQQQRTRLVRRLIADELRADPAITTDEETASESGIARHGIDVSIVKLDGSARGRNVEIECEIRVAISDSRGKMLSFVTGSARVQVPRRTFRRQYLPQLRKEAMENAVKGIHQDLVAFLSRTARR